MPITIQNCPLCGASQATDAHHPPAFDQRRVHEIQVINLLCPNCGLVYQSPRMSDDELGAFYAQEYRILYQGNQGPNLKDLAVQAGRAQALLEFTSHSIKKVSRHLDIGCSAGLLLHQFSAAYHCLPVGIEPGDAYRGYAQADGLTVYPALEELSAQINATTGPTNRFDLISLAHVLEHIPQPVSYLADLRQNWLTPDGWLLVEVPNLYGHDCFEVAHLVSYSPHTLRQTLARAGYQIITEAIHGRPRSELIPLYITVLARPKEIISQIEIEPEKSVQRKRRLAMLRRSLVTRLSPRRAWLPIPETSQS